MKLFHARRFTSGCRLLVGLILTWVLGGEVLADTGPHDLLSNLWNFDTQKPGETPTGFSAGMVGDGQQGQWRIEADPQAPTAPNRLVQATPCPNTATAGCLQVLLAEGVTYEFPDLMVRLRMTSDGQHGAGGIVFGAKDVRNFYAAVVDLITDTLELLRVAEGQITVLGHEAVKRKQSVWHLLRVQHNTNLSKDYIEINFDGHLVFSTRDKTLGAGKIGLLTRGDANVGFDSFHAIQLYSQRLLSPPAAY
jgi:hypothetical protein